MLKPFSFTDHLIGPLLVFCLGGLLFFVRRGAHQRDEQERERMLRRGQTPPGVTSWPWRRGLIVSAGSAAFYLLVFRGLSFIPHFWQDGKGGAILMSFSFLFLGPLVAGYITVDQAATRKPFSIGYCVVAPWIPILFNIALAVCIAWEGLICAIFIVPPAMISASLGGLAAGFIHRYRHKQSSPSALMCMAALPLVLCLVEVQLHQPLQIRRVHTDIAIHAPAAIVWQNIERVPAIAPSELRSSWANTIGFPRPVEATLSYEGVGGVRNASFERGLTFTETVTDWQPLQRLAFTIQANTASIPPTTLDEHVTVGGRFFDVLTGEYELQPLSNGDTLLHLSSRERLSTDFNAYAAMWSDSVMRDMQSNILHVIQHRCEQQASVGKLAVTSTNATSTMQAQVH